jgi:hypothetical protein
MSGWRYRADSGLEMTDHVFSTPVGREHNIVAARLGRFAKKIDRYRSHRAAHSAGVFSATVKRIVASRSYVLRVIRGQWRF